MKFLKGIFVIFMILFVMSCSKNVEEPNYDGLILNSFGCKFEVHYIESRDGYNFYIINKLFYDNKGELTKKIKISPDYYDGYVFSSKNKKYLISRGKDKYLISWRHLLESFIIEKIDTK